MRTVKSFSNLAEAGFASSLLEAVGIHTLLADEQSFLWSYGMAIQIRLQVEEADVERAQQILENGLCAADETAAPPAAELRPPPSEPGNIPIGLFVAAAVLFAVLVVIVRNPTKDRRAKASQSREETYDFDQNHDGRADYFVTYFDDRITKTRADRNFDGRADEWMFFDSEGRPERAEFDNNFDGQPDEWFVYRNGLPETSRQDTDFNGRFDWVTSYDHGVVARSDARPNESQTVSRTLLYESGVLREERVDEDGDGKFDYKILYDPYGSMSERIPLGQPK